MVALGVKEHGSKQLLIFQSRLWRDESESWWWGFISDLPVRQD